MTSFLIGFPRADGSFEALVAMNNDEFFCDLFFKETAERLRQDFSEVLERDVQILERQNIDIWVDLGGKDAGN